MPAKIDSTIELYMGPANVGEPDDLEAAITGFIDGAQRYLDIAVQEIDSHPIAKAIVEARRRKVRVRTVIEQDYLKSASFRDNPFEPGGPLEKNRFLMNAILRAAANVKADYNTAIFHQKFIVRDGTSLLTGSTNFTHTGTHRNLNHVVIVHDKAVARAYSKEFREIMQGRFGALSKTHGEKPAEVTVSNVPIKILFAPDHSPEMEVMKQMLKAKSRIDFAIFTFAQSSGIDDAMIARTTAGSTVRVRGALDKRMANQKWAATRPVKNAGAELYLVGPQGSLGKLHHKLMVIDEQVTIIGSFNYTGPANKFNDENILVIGDLESTSQQSIDRQKKLAGYALEAIDRIIETYGERVD